MAVQGVLAKHLHTTATQFSKATVATSRAAAFYGPKRDAKATPNVRALNATAVAAPVLAEAPAAAPVPLPPPRKPVKKSINDAKFQFKFVVPNSLVGCFLGRGGANVNRVKDETGVYIQFTKPGTAVNTERDRMLILAADDVETARHAFSLLMDLVASVDGALGRLRTKETGERLYFQQVIPTLCAGNIMGPAGETIKGIGARTGCNLLVQPKVPNAAFIPFRVVDFTAPDHRSLVAAVGEVMDRLVVDEKYEAGIRDVRSVCMRIIKVPHMRVGAILGPGGSHIKAVQEMMRVKIGVSETQEARPTMRYVTLWGDPLNVKVAIDAVYLATGQLQAEMDRRHAGGSSAGSSADYGTDDDTMSQGGWTPRSSGSRGGQQAQRGQRGQQAQAQAQQQQAEEPVLAAAGSNGGGPQ